MKKDIIQEQFKVKLIIGNGTYGPIYKAYDLSSKIILQSKKQIK